MTNDVKNPILKYFKYAHSPESLAKVSQACSHLAEIMELMLPENAEKSAGLRKLLEAKDCFVRAMLAEGE